MGNNLDLVEMLGLPKEVPCPVCKGNIAYFDDYDIECGDPFHRENRIVPRQEPEEVYLELDCHCNMCDISFTYHGRLKIDNVEIVKE